MVWHDVVSETDATSHQFTRNINNKRRRNEETIEGFS